MSFVYEWFRFERLMVAARCLGAAERLVDEMTAFAAAARGRRRAARRQAAGAGHARRQPHRAVRRPVDGLRDRPRRSTPAPTSRSPHAQCSMAKLYACEMAGRVADRAVQVFGGRGYMRENVAERFFRELRVERIWEGASEVQRVDHRRPAGQAGPRPARVEPSRPDVVGWPREQPSPPPGPAWSTTPRSSRPVTPPLPDAVAAYQRRRGEWYADLVGPLVVTRHRAPRRARRRAGLRGAHRRRRRRRRASRRLAAKQGPSAGRPRGGGARPRRPGRQRPPHHRRRRRGTRRGWPRRHPGVRRAARRPTRPPTGWQPPTRWPRPSTT